MTTYRTPAGSIILGSIVAACLMLSHGHLVAISGTTAPVDRSHHQVVGIHRAPSPATRHQRRSHVVIIMRSPLVSRQASKNG